MHTCTKPAVDWVGGYIDIDGERVPGELWCCQEHLDMWLDDRWAYPH